MLKHGRIAHIALKLVTSAVLAWPVTVAYGQNPANPATKPLTPEQAQTAKAQDAADKALISEAGKPTMPREPLVTDETITTQKSLTKAYKLDNGIPVVVRTIEGSDILQLSLSFAHGLKDLPVGKKSLNEWYWGVAPLAGEGYTKEKVYSETEKYGIDVGCQGGIELSACAVATLNEYWDKALPLFASVVTKPALTDGDVKLTKDRLTAKLKAVPSDPGNYVNEIVNSVYYAPGHPYRLNHDEALKELETLGKKDLQEFGKSVLNSALMSFVVVGSVKPEKVVADLNKYFGQLPKAEFKHVAPAQPSFAADQALGFTDRELPTAYLRVKFGSAPITDKDAIASRMMFEILSEELGEEIRTKRSLSYSVHAYPIQYSLGIGVLSASTSKPKETFEAMSEVINKMKTRTYSVEELEEYKHGFATNYFLTLETHGSLAAALANAQHYYRSSDELYDLPRRLDKVTPDDIKRLANEQLVDMRVGVIFGRKDFDDDWAMNFIAAHRKATH